jgi:protocatechuate 3,4-dioxygenase alpha subunit
MMARASKNPVGGTAPRGTTPSQTIGPFHRIMVPWEGGDNLTKSEDPAAIIVRGQVFDGQKTPVDDCVIEIWQANVHGRYAHPDDTREVPLIEGFEGFGRVITDKDGRFELVTVKPGCVPGRNESVQAPHISLSLFARGLLKRLTTRVYFADEQAANEKDPVLQSIADAPRRETLIATRHESQSKPPVYEFVIRLQGDKETVFFDI